MTRTSILKAFLLSLGMLLVTGSLAAQTYRSDHVENLSDRPFRILQTNAAGTNIHVINPATNRVVGIIDGIVRPHGAVLHPEGTYYYITNEHDATVDVVDTRTLQIVKSIPLVARPNNLSGSDLVRKIYVAITAAPFVQVISMDTNETVGTIPMVGGVHNTFVTPDGKFAVAGLTGGQTFSVMDTSTDQVVWDIKVEDCPQAGRCGVRPFGFETNPDGSTKRAFVEITGWHGFYVIDWAQRRIVDKVAAPDLPPTELIVDGSQGAPSHGLTVTPDQKQLWISSRIGGSLFVWSLPDLTYVGRVETYGPDWITSSPDSRYVYASIASHNTTTVVDTRTLEIVAVIPVGQVPKRLYTAIFPAGWEFSEGDND